MNTEGEILFGLATEMSRNLCNLQKLWKKSSNPCGDLALSPLLVMDLQRLSDFKIYSRFLVTIFPERGEKAAPSMKLILIWGRLTMNLLLQLERI